MKLHLTEQQIERLIEQHLGTDSEFGKLLYDIEYIHSGGLYKEGNDWIISADNGRIDLSIHEEMLFRILPDVELKVYVVNVNNFDDKEHYYDTTDEEFMKMADDENTVYTLHEFQETMNDGIWDTFTESYIRYIHVLSDKTVVNLPSESNDNSSLNQKIQL
jgi:hypothetical protein